MLKLGELLMDYITYRKKLYALDLSQIRHFIHSYNSNYALATMLFPRRIKEATLTVYSFVRYADELVDNPQDYILGQTHDTIAEFINEFNNVVEFGINSNTSVHPVIRANYFLFKNYDIPFSYLTDFLNVMLQDTHIKKYKSYAELEHYMWGSASVIGHIMTHIIGYKDSVAFDDARALAEAMQLANFLRDIDEDYQQRKRIYLPEQDRVAFGVTEQMIKERVMTKELYNLVYHYAHRTEVLFKKGIFGIHYLKSGKFSVLLAARIYQKNLYVLKKVNYDPFKVRIRLSVHSKIMVLFSTICMYPFWKLKNKP
jgi:phytoene synthase